MAVVSVRYLFFTIILWLAMNLIDLTYFHWFEESAKEIFEVAFWQITLVLSVWVLNGRKISA